MAKLRGKLIISKNDQDRSYGKLGRFARYNLAIIIALATSTPLAANTAEIDQKRLLESRVWVADDSELPQLEREVVREIQMEPNSAFGHYLLSHISVRMLASDPTDSALLEQATTSAQQAIEIAPNTDLGYGALVELLDLTGNTEKGLSLISDLKRVGLTPSWRLQLLEARLAGNSRKPEEILTLYRNALDDKNAIREIITPFLISALSSDDKKSEIVKLQDWHARYPHQNFLSAVAARYAELGNYSEAHENYQRVTRLDPTNREALVNDAILLYKHLNKYSESLASFDRALSMHGQLSHGIQPVFNIHRGAVLLLLNKKREAFQSYTAALRSAQSPEAVLGFIGQTLADAKRSNELIELLVYANDELPGIPALHAYLGELYSSTTGNQSAALESFTNAITLEPNESQHYNSAGLVYYKLGAYSDALKLFSAAVKVNPFDATARYNEACVLARTGKTDSALDALASAIELDEGLKQTASTDSDFAELTNTKKFKDLLDNDPEVQVAH